jgi:hypothetical protein
MKDILPFWSYPSCPNFRIIHSKIINDPEEQLQLNGSPSSTEGFSGKENNVVTPSSVAKESEPPQKKLK